MAFSDQTFVSMAETTHIAVVPIPVFSHIVSIVELSKRLVQLHPNFHVTCIIPSLESPPNNFKAYLETLPPNIDSIFLPPINKQDLPQVSNPIMLIRHTVTLSLPSLHEVLKSLTSQAPLAALVADFFACEALDFANEFNTLCYIYFPVASMLLSVLLYIPKLDQEISGEFSDLTEPIKIPGCVPIMGSDIPTSLQNRSGENHKRSLELAKRMFSVNGILVNSFLEMESGSIRALAEEGTGKPDIYYVGPITQKGSIIGDNGSECLRWLDKQQPSSVLYISFGSGSTLSQNQLNELALGLELSGQKFLWVLRAPSNSTFAAHVGSQNEDTLQFLPSCFLERTKDQGFVVPSWAPQIKVLSHNSVGGFLSHCGWNSILESVQEGVPLITWPLFADQRMNAVILTDGLKVALRPKVNEDGIVEREEIAKVVKCLMETDEGKGMHKRMKDLQVAAANTLKEDGSSTKTLSLLASKWEKLGGI